MEAHRARRCFYVLPSPSLSSNYVSQCVTRVCCPLPVLAVSGLSSVALCCPLPVQAVTNVNKNESHTVIRGYNAIRLFHVDVMGCFMTKQTVLPNKEGSEI